MLAKFLDKFRDFDDHAGLIAVPILVPALAHIHQPGASNGPRQMLERRDRHAGIIIMVHDQCGHINGRQNRAGIICIGNFGIILYGVGRAAQPLMLAVERL